MNKDRILVRNWLLLFYATLLIFLFQGCLAKEEGKVPPVPSGDLHEAVAATWFSFARGADDADGISAWNDVSPLTEENPWYVALPFNPLVYPQDDPLRQAEMKNRWVMVRERSAGKVAYAQVEDVGPWFVNDHGYVFDPLARPFAETARGSGYDIYRAPSAARIVRNPAGIDLSPAVAAHLAITGVGSVDWRFVDAAEVPAGPWKEKISTTPPHWRSRSSAAPFIARD